MRTPLLWVLGWAAAAQAGALPYRAPLKMLSPTHGYALVSSQGEAGLPDQVLETRDAGKHWTAVPDKPGKMAVLLPGGAPAWFGRPAEICPAGLENTPEGQRPLWSFLDASHAWVAGCGDLTEQREIRALYRTDDAGVTWKRAASTSPTDAAGALPVTGHKSGMVFTEPGKGWVFGQEEAGGVYLFATRDGGKSWSRQDVPAPKNAWRGFRQQPDTLHFFGAKDALLLMDIQLSTEEPTPTLYLSNDAGQHWKPVGPAPGHHLSFADERHGFAAEGERLFSTRDGGKRWNRVSEGLGKIDGLQFISAEVGWLWSCGSSLDERCQLLLTKDGGRLWFVLDPQVVEAAQE